jgi:hypothetical protein
MAEEEKTKGILYDVYTGANYLFWDLKALCEALGINYAHLMANLKDNNVYVDRFQVTYYDVPHYTSLKNVTPIFNG